MKQVTIIGSTGSVGTQAIEVAARGGFGLCALAAYANVDRLEQQVRAHRPRVAALYDERAAHELRKRVAGLGVTVLGGAAGVEQAAGDDGADIALNAAVGIAGLGPTLSALRRGLPLALANKESLVCAGALVMALAKRRGAPVLPVDSEHSAVFQALRAGRADEVAQIILTASGGPFFGKSAAELEGVTAGDALRHPTWSMGQKITIDSATMMNKGFEVIEAMWLFDLPPEKIDVLVHRESIVHSMARFCDGSVIAQLSRPDMRLPIAYALSYPDRLASPDAPLDLAALGQLTFARPDRAAFPALALCERVARLGGNAGAVVNGANEQAVELFLRGAIGFADITRLTARALETVPFIETPALEDVYDSDARARAVVREAAAGPAG